MELLSRRLFLRKAATLPVAAAVVGVPLIAHANPSTETDAMIAAGRALDRAEAAFARADTAKASARKLCDALCPPLPDELIMGRDDPLSHCARHETDVEGQHVYPPDTVEGEGKVHAHLQRQIYAADYLRLELEDRSPRSKLGREAKRLLAIADRYEAAVRQARDASGLPAAMEAREDASRDLDMAAQALCGLPASSMLGVALKARAIIACAKIGVGEKYRALLVIGPGLADDAARIAAEERGAS